MREPSASNTWTRYQTHFARVTSRLYKPFSCSMQSRACDTRYCSSVIKWDGARKRKSEKRVQFNNFSSKKKTTTTTTTRKAWPEYDQNLKSSSIIRLDMRSSRSGGGRGWIEAQNGEPKGKLTLPRPFMSAYATDAVTSSGSVSASTRNKLKEQRRSVAMDWNSIVIERLK